MKNTAMHTPATAPPEVGIHDWNRNTKEECRRQNMHKLERRCDSLSDPIEPWKYIFIAMPVDIPVEGTVSSSASAL